MSYIPGPMPRTPEWYALRRYDPDRRERPIVFGATAAAAVCCISPYQTPFEFFLECKGLSGEREETDAMRMGRRLEPIVLDEYEERRHVKLLRDLPMFLSEAHNFMGATPDAMADTDHERWAYAVDAKTTTFRRIDKQGGDHLKFGEEGTDHVPSDLVMQCQQQCAVLEVGFVELPVLFDARTLRIYRVERNDDLIAAIVKAESEMAQRLANDDPPEPNWTHENTRELIGLLFGRDDDKLVELNEEDLERWLEIQRRKDQVAIFEELIKADSNRLLYKLQGAAQGTFPKGSKGLKRIAVKESIVTEKDVADLQSRIGQTKRRGYEFLKEYAVE